MKSRCNGLVLGLVVVLTCAAHPASGQEVDPGSPSSTPRLATDADLDRIREALASEPAISLSAATRFSIEVIVRRPTFADYLKGSDLRAHVARPMPPGDGYSAAFAGGGFDLLQLIGAGVERFRNAQHQRTIRKIRERIDRELQALSAER